MTDPFAEFKSKQREDWKHFAPFEALTMMPAARLVRCAGVRGGDHVLDVGCGTGVAAISARRAGATTVGVDLTPELLARAKENASIAGFDDMEWKQGDVESLGFADATFDVVLSHFGHIFAPRPEVAASEMLRILRPGGRIAFATWPPESVVGRGWGIVNRYVPPPPEIPAVAEWGDPVIVTKRLGSAVTHLHFERGLMVAPALSPAHYRQASEQVTGPMARLVQSLEREPAKLLEFRRAYDALTAEYFQENSVQRDYLMTRAVKR